MSELHVLFNGEKAGKVTQDNGKLSFTYTDEWRDAIGAYPLSTAMPLALKKHGHTEVEAFLWGLLPDNETTLQKWARRFQVSARNPFALLANVGEDCAGAAQFVTPERLAHLAQDSPPPDIQWLTDQDIGQRLRQLREDAAAGRTPRDTGQFSLAGAQPKTALLKHGSKWGIPSGQIPTTHILKPPTGELDGIAENEHLCLITAAKLGLRTAHSSIQSFDGELAIVVERYDRMAAQDLRAHYKNRLDTLVQRYEIADPSNTRLITALQSERAEITLGLMNLKRAAGQLYVRIHQEDFCQALAVNPLNKYQQAGGPSPEQIIEHLRYHSNMTLGETSDIDSFRDALIYNWMIYGTDAHAKNYSMTFNYDGSVSLAPFYDMISFIPYADLQNRGVKLAMKIGDEYSVLGIRLAEWIDFSKKNRLDQTETLDRIRHFSISVPEAMRSALSEMAEMGVSHPVAEKVTERVCARCDMIHGWFEQ